VVVGLGWVWQGLTLRSFFVECVIVWRCFILCEKEGCVWLLKGCELLCFGGMFGVV